MKTGYLLYYVNIPENPPTRTLRPLRWYAGRLPQRSSIQTTWTNRTVQIKLGNDVAVVLTPVE